MDIRYLDGKNKDILIVAPHGPYKTKEEKIKHRNDKRTGIIAEELHNILGCFTIINDAYIKPDENKKETPSLKDKKLDLFKVKQAKKVPGYLKAIKDAVDKHDGKTLVVWLHGISDGNADSEKIEHVKANLMKEGDGDLHALIGYGQGKPSRYTAKQKTVDTIRDELTKQGLRTLITRKDAGNYRGRDTDRLNQWFRTNKYPLEKVQSFQIEIREKGFREDAEQCRNTTRIIAAAISATLEMKPVMKEGAVLETQPVKPTASNKIITESTVPTDVPVLVQNNEAEIVQDDEDPVVIEAFEHLKDIFRRHFHDAMVEAGRYIIDTFYGGDPIVAFAKNKTREQPPNLKALVQKISEATSVTDDGAPSLGWFYNAVNLAAHEEICHREGLQTFAMLGHSHKLQLLHVPKLKQIEGDRFEEAIKPAFQEKERLAIIAKEKGLSVRVFKKFIDEQYPDEKIDLTALPSDDKLRSLGLKKLERLRKTAKKKIEDSQKQIAAYTASLTSMDAVLAEIYDAAAKGKGQKKK